MYSHTSPQCLKITRKGRTLIFEFWHFLPTFILFRFQKLAKPTIFGIFNHLLSTQNVNVARFARNVECDYFWNFSNTVIK